MGNISQISVDGETHKVKDAEARNAANSALTTANEAKTAADEAVATANDKISKRLSERDFFERLSSYYDALESVNNVRIKNIYLSKLIKVLLNPQILEEEPELLHTFKVKK